MKIVKHFFNENNRLNKGYGVTGDITRNNRMFFRKKFEHILPPVEVIAEYENIYPGILEKMVAMAKKEQTHKHELDIILLKAQELKLKLAKNISITTIIVTASAGLWVTIAAGNIYIFALSIIIFSLIAAAKLLYCKKQDKIPSEHRDRDRRQNRFVRKNSYKYR